MSRQCSVVKAQPPPLSTSPPASQRNTSAIPSNTPPASVTENANPKIDLKTSADFVTVSGANHDCPIIIDDSVGPLHGEWLVVTRKKKARLLLKMKQDPPVTNIKGKTRVRWRKTN
jgi:hypothetical protein